LQRQLPCCAILAVLLSVVTGWYLFFLPAFSFALSERQTWTLALFTLVATINVVLVSGLVGGLLIHEERQRFLIRELKHRSQNLFAIIRFVWRESEGPPVSPPTRKGFGTAILFELAKSFASNVQANYAPAGLVYELEAPLSANFAQRSHRSGTGWREGSVLNGIRRQLVNNEREVLSGVVSAFPKQISVTGKDILVKLSLPTSFGCNDNAIT
jgi:hypothetical protein